MSTEFVSETTNEVAFLRFFGGPDRGACFDFGSMTNFERVLTALDSGERFRPVGGSLDTDPSQTRQGFEQLVRDGRATFGEMSFTLELGSGDFVRLFEEEW